MEMYRAGFEKVVWAGIFIDITYTMDCQYKL